MSELALYSNAFVIVEGTLWAQAASVTVEKKSNSTPMFTLHSGFAGLSQGAGLVEITVDSAVPSADFEFNPDRKILAGQSIEIGIVMASRQSVFKGFITEATYSHSVNDASKLSMKFVCRFAEFE